MFGAAIAGIGLLSSGIQALSGASQKSAAKKALAGYKRQDLDNVYKDVQVSTRGADLQKEQQARLQAGQIDALAGAGTRGLIGGLGRVEDGSQAVSQQIGADLDKQQKEIDQLRAQDETRIQRMQEAREQADIAGLSSQYQAGQQQMWSGIGGMAQSAMAGLGAMGQGQSQTQGSQVSAPGVQQVVYRDTGSGTRYNQTFN